MVIKSFIHPFNCFFAQQISECLQYDAQWSRAGAGDTTINKIDKSHSWRLQSKVGWGEGKTDNRQKIIIKLWSMSDGDEVAGGEKLHQALI